MAPVVEKKILGAAGAGEALDITSVEEEGQNLWSSILSEVSTRSRSKLPSGRNILVFGEDGSGKTTLMAKLQGADHNKKGRGLEYLYLNVHDEDRDDQTRCNVWILDGDLYHKGLLKFAVSADSLKETIAIFVADMSRPWTIMESLQKWASVLREHVDKLKVQPEEMREMEQKLIKDFQEYIEPDEGTPGSPQRRGPPVSGQDDENVILPLGENVLTHNLGVPVLVVCTKCDGMSILEKEHDYREEHFDFIQSHIRRFCLQYGAALIYTSVKEEKNLDLLYRYVVHKTYGFQFTTPALVVEKDAVFIPERLANSWFSFLGRNHWREILHTLAFLLPACLNLKQLVHDKEVAAEDEQVFLMKQQSLLAKQPVTPTRSTVSICPSRGGQGGRQPRGKGGPRNLGSSSPGTSVKKSNPQFRSTAANEGVLANFFNSLLSKKTGSPGSPGAGGVQSTVKKPGQKPVLSNVQEELDRMTRKPDSITTNSTSATENEA
ncbi:cytoplasmic dynein 1 light intermediate chain 2 [Protopterus annectens]|uniref:cytoplasmic dynein 1 light intermediate chain 2 n=1 Tax=Protopterus annectens TaxID=7888 RepID=UPI001CFA2A99|nr:cytoplasmic dynein 1 light intermediate chain 2 [Protopterus annectens]